MIQPAAVAGLGRRAVAAVAAAKHHTLLCTTAGEVWTFGSNRHGQLGYAVDSQPTPRRVTSLRARVVAVAAANKHSVAVAAGGEVYTWGSNALGQVRLWLMVLLKQGRAGQPLCWERCGTAPCRRASPPAHRCTLLLLPSPSPRSWATAPPTPAPARLPAWWRRCAASPWWPPPPPSGTPWC